MTDKLTDKQKVQVVWPDAVAQGHGVLYYIQNGKDGDVLGFSLKGFEKAWADAARLIDNQKTKQ